MVLMDIMMPELDGYDTIRIIRGYEQFKNLPIIAVTAKSDERGWQEMPRRGRVGLHRKAGERRTADIIVARVAEPVVDEHPGRTPCANILVVDDEPHSLKALQALLCGPDRNVVAAASGREALRWILRAAFALILWMCACPRWTGFETAALIRNSSAPGTLPSCS